MLLFIRHNKKGRAKMARFLYSAFSDEAADSIDGQIAACKANGYNFATYNVIMIQRDIPYETALAQCIESDDVAAGEI